MASLYIPKWQMLETDAGGPLTGGLLYFYITTTTTPKNTYPTEADAIAGTNANANPVVLNAYGRPTSEIWIAGRYRLIVKTSAGVTISDDDPVEDNVTGSTSQQQAASWGGNNSGTANALVFTYSPAITSYTNGTLLRGRITADNSTAVTVNAGAGAKNLVKQDGTALIAGDLQGPGIISFVYDSTSDVMRLQSPDGHLFRDGINAPARADVASATTTNLDTAATNYARITGTTTITGITLTNGRRRDVVFEGALTLTHNATTLILPTGANITTAAGDTATIIGESGGVRVTDYQKASGLALATASAVSAAAVGSVIGFGYTQDATAVSTSSTIPIDNTIPQSGEGAEYTQIATTYTPQISTSLLVIDVFLPVVSSSAANGQLAFALFQDTGLNALIATFLNASSTTAISSGIRIRHVLPAVSTTAQTFKVRYGANTGTAYIGSDTGATNLFSTKRVASMTIMEIKQ